MFVGQQVMSRCYWHVLATVQRPPPIAGRLPGVSESGLRPSPATTRGPDQCRRASEALVQDVPAQRMRWTLMPRPC
jgi:hypothetical protein